MSRRWLSALAVLFPLALAGTAPVADAATTVTIATAPGSRDAKAEAALLQGLIERHILPRANALADATAALPPILAGFCAAPDDKGLGAVRQAYASVMHAWAGVQHLRPGPLGLELRADRIAFWPDKRSVGARQLAPVLAKKDPSLLAPGALSRQSAAVQGLPALERLLYDDGLTAAGFAGDSAYRCQLASAIAVNVATLAREVVDGWIALGPKLLAGEETTPAGKGAGEALNNLYLAVLTAVQVVEDQKLRIPLGPKPGEAKPALAEAARSGLSLKLMADSVAALRGAVLGEKGPQGDAPGFVALLSPKDKEAETAKLTKAFDTLAAAIAAVPEPLDATVTEPAKRNKAEAALKAAKTLQGLITQELPPLLGITVGFNELDGD